MRRAVCSLALGAGRAVQRRAPSRWTCSAACAAREGSGRAGWRRSPSTRTCAGRRRGAGRCGRTAGGIEDRAAGCWLTVKGAERRGGTFRATGITAYLSNGWNAQARAADRRARVPEDDDRAGGHADCRRNRAYRDRNDRSQKASPPEGEDGRSAARPRRARLVERRASPASCHTGPRWRGSGVESGEVGLERGVCRRVRASVLCGVFPCWTTERGSAAPPTATTSVAGNRFRVQTDEQFVSFLRGA